MSSFLYIDIKPFLTRTSGENSHFSLLGSRGMPTKLCPFNLLLLKQMVIGLCHLSSSFNCKLVHEVENVVGKVLMQTSNMFAQ